MPKQDQNFVFQVNGKLVYVESIQRDVKKELALQFQTIRKELGMSQQELADAINTARPNVTRLERGDYNPTIEMVVRAAAALGKQVKISLE